MHGFVLLTLMFEHLAFTLPHGDKKHKILGSGINWGRVKGGHLALVNFSLIANGATKLEWGLYVMLAKAADRNYGLMGGVQRRASRACTLDDCKGCQ